MNTTSFLISHVAIVRFQQLILQHRYSDRHAESWKQYVQLEERLLSLPYPLSLLSGTNCVAVPNTTSHQCINKKSAKIVTLTF